MDYLHSKTAGETLFILGNGFDLNLDFPTSYKDFFSSDFSPFVHKDHGCHSLGRFIYQKGVLDKWYDLENLLAEYGKNVGRMDDEGVQGDKDDYKKLVHGLADYLATIDFSKPNVNSVAAKILGAAEDLIVPPKFYTFNYSDFSTIALALGINCSTASHIHGSLRSKNIVLGVGEYVRLSPCVSYLHKTSNPTYNSGGILNALESYDTIIIFGLSLSQVDYPYFEDFFKDVSSRRYRGDRKKYIRIFTRDEKSRMEILDNLRGMNSGLIKLMGYCDFDIIKTEDNSDELKVKEVINHLSRNWKIALLRKNTRK